VPRWRRGNSLEKIRCRGAGYQADWGKVGDFGKRANDWKKG